MKNKPKSFSIRKSKNIYSRIKIEMIFNLTNKVTVQAKKQGEDQPK